MATDRGLTVFPRVRREDVVKFRALGSKQKKYLSQESMTEKPPGKSIITHARERESEALGNPVEGQTFGERLEELFDNPNEVILEISTVFPFDLFPDHVRIDPLKIQV